MMDSLQSGASLPFSNGSKILTDLIALRRAVGGLKAEKKKGVMFPVKSAKDLMKKLRTEADELNMPMAGAVIHSTTFQLDGIEVFNKPGIGCHTTVTVRFMSSDGSYVDFAGSGHGTSNDDKAGGKASTYAWKDAVVKGLSLPDDDMVDTDDEAKPITAAPRKFFKKGS
jgi:hypothetical protein